MFDHLDALLAIFRRIVLTSKFAGVEQNSQNLRVRASSPLRHQEQAAENQQPTEETAEQVESRRAHDQRDEEQLPLCPQNCQWLIESLVNEIHSAFEFHNGSPY